MSAIPMNRGMVLLDHFRRDETAAAGGEGGVGGAGVGAKRRSADACKDRAARRLRRLAVALDSSFTVPGINFKFGIDPLLGLIPGVGDVITTLLSLYIVFEGWRLGATSGQIARMLGNVAIDLLIGFIPVLGDLFDFAFRANLRNLRILGVEASGVHIEFDPRAWGDR